MREEVLEERVVQRSGLGRQRWILQGLHLLCNITKVKEAYDKTHWENVKKYDRQPRCRTCADVEKSGKFLCARCEINGEKQWFGKDHFHPTDLYNCKKRQTWAKLQCRQP